MCSDRRLRRALVAALLLALAVTPAAAKLLLNIDEALRLAFPDGEIERETVFLTDEEMAAAEEPLSRALVLRYVARRGDAVVGTAYLDTHIVRTVEETLLVVVTPAGTVDRVEVLSFDEPLDYLPREGWYGQFSGRGLDEDLRLDRGIRAVTGATLTGTATTAAARRVLAVHRLIEKRGAAR